MSACAGHGENQSMAVHEVSAGNLRQRLRKASPTGDMQMHRCSSARTRSMKNSQQLSRVSMNPAALTSVRIALTIVVLVLLSEEVGG